MPLSKQCKYTYVRAGIIRDWNYTNQIMHTHSSVDGYPLFAPERALIGIWLILDGHAIDTLVDTRLTLVLEWQLGQHPGQQSVKSCPIFGKYLYVGRHFAEYSLIVDRLSTRMLIACRLSVKYQSRLLMRRWSRVNWGYWLTPDHGCFEYTSSYKPWYVVIIFPSVSLWPSFTKPCLPTRFRRQKIMKKSAYTSQNS